MNEVGTVLWHSLDGNGNIDIYDIRWPDGSIERNIPARLLESVKEHRHSNEGHQKRNTRISERKYKRGI